MLSNLHKITLQLASNDPNAKEVLACSNCGGRYHEEDGEPCTQCNDSDSWWDNLPDSKAVEVFEDYLRRTNNWENFKEFLPDYFEQLFQVNKND